jgi:hypothetical protein
MEPIAIPAMEPLVSFVPLDLIAVGVVVVLLFAMSDVVAGVDEVPIVLDVPLVLVLSGIQPLV